MSASRIKVLPATWTRSCNHSTAQTASERQSTRSLRIVTNPLKVYLWLYNVAFIIFNIRIYPSVSYYGNPLSFCDSCLFWLVGFNFRNNWIDKIIWLGLTWGFSTTWRARIQSRVARSLGRKDEGKHVPSPTYFMTFFAHFLCRVHRLMVPSQSFSWARWRVISNASMWIMNHLVWRIIMVGLCVWNLRRIETH